MKNEILIIMPVYNEEDMIEKVIDDWLSLEINLNFKILLVNDGSKDRSKEIIEKKMSNNKKIILLNKKNAGHGPAIITGYRYGVENEYEYIFQTDSDYQFRSNDFIKLWKHCDKGFDIVAGTRKIRNDSFLRVFLSKFILRPFLFLVSGKLLLDPNVPYRLMNYNFLKNFLEQIGGKNYIAPNILMSIFSKKIKYIQVNHYKRLSGELNWKFNKLLNFGYALILEILNFAFRNK